MHCQWWQGMTSISLYQRWCSGLWSKIGSVCVCEDVYIDWANIKACQRCNKMFTMGHLETVQINQQRTSKENYKLTNFKFSRFWRHSTLFNWILHKTSVVTFITFLHTLNPKGAGAVSLARRQPRIIAVNFCTVFLPLKLKIISCGFNIEGYVCSSRYFLVLRMLCDCRGNNWERKGVIQLMGDFTLHRKNNDLNCEKENESYI